MPLLLLKDLPRYECLLEAAKRFPDLDPSACDVFLNLLRTGDEVFRVTENNYASHGLSQGRFGVLMLLWRCSCAPTEAGAGEHCLPDGPLTPAELAAAAGVTRATMTGLIARHTGQPAERVRADSERDRWFSAEEALDYGIVDHILERVDDIRPDVVSRAAGL